jgi:hypothetical protein
VNAQAGQPQTPAANSVSSSQSAIPHAANTSGLDKWTAPAMPTSQATARAGEPAVTEAAELAISPPAAPSGTPVATNGVRMKSAVKKNDFAGSTLQVLPSDRQTAPLSGGGESASQGARPSQPIVIDFSTERETAAQWMVVDATHAGGANLTVTANAGGAGSPATPPVSELERMISREVTMVRQSGAESLAVTLKVDSRTSLFLQLTNHNGQIEASVRCDKGGAGALEHHWGELQESLARQNVQLLPLQNNSRDSSEHRPATAGDFHDQQPPQREPQPRPRAEAEASSGEAGKAAAGLRQAKARPQPRHGWEEWA